MCQSMKKLLFIAYHFPPDAEVGGSGLLSLSNIFLNLDMNHT